MKPNHCKSARELLEWKQADLAEAAGISTATVKRFESGLAPVSDEAIQKMRDAFSKKLTVFDDDAEGGVGVRFKKKRPK
jgi:hypothetical protein